MWVPILTCRQTSVDNRSLPVEKIEGFEKLLYSAFDKAFVEPAVFHEDELHIPKTHLCRLHDEHDVPTMRSSDFELIQQPSNVVPTGQLSRRKLWAHFFIHGKLSMEAGCVDIHFESNISMT